MDVMLDLFLHIIIEIILLFFLDYYIINSKPYILLCQIIIVIISKIAKIQ